MSGGEDGCFGADRGWRGQPLDTARLVLRPVTADDAEAMAELLADPDLYRHLPELVHPMTPELARHTLADVAKRMKAGDTIALAVTSRIDGRFIGFAGFGIDGDVAAVGYWMGRPWWHQGYCVEALRRILRLAFAAMGMRKAVAEVTAGNTASQDVLARLGFQKTCGSEACSVDRNGDPLWSYVLPRERWEAQQAHKETVLVAAAALIDADGRVLLARRPEGKPLAGLWEFPGGKIDDGEAPEAALVRELEEELGIDVRAACLAPFTFASHDYDSFHLLMPLYVVRNWRGEVQAREGQALAWVRPARLGDYPMPPADVPLVAFLRDWL